jgi:DNA repair exonuclease SbcCD nuclease subunit
MFPYPRRSELKSDPKFKSMSPEEISVYISRKMEEILSGFSAKIERDAVNILVGHFTVGGSIYSKEQNVPPFDISVRKEFLEPFDIVCLGHLHEPQEFYSGAIARNGFGEQDMKVGFKVYDIQPGEKPVEQFIELPAREFITLSPEEFMNNGHINPEAAVRVKGKVKKYEYDEMVRRMKSLNHPFMKNSLEVELETAGSNGGDVSEEPTTEEAIKLWATGREGIGKFLDKLIVAAKEVEQKINEAR